MPTKETLVNQARQEVTSMMREFVTQQRIIEIWNTLDFSSGMTQEELGSKNADIAPADLAAYVQALDAINTLLDANNKAVRKALYKMLRMIDP